MTYPYITDPICFHEGQIVRTTPDPTRDDKVMHLGRIVDSSGISCPVRIAWLTCPQWDGEPFQSWVAPHEILRLTHETATLVLEQLERRAPDRTHLDAVSYGVEGWIDRVADGEPLPPERMGQYVDNFHDYLMDLFYKNAMRDRKAAVKKFNRETYQRLQREHSHAWKRIHAANQTERLPALTEPEYPSWMR